MGTDEIPRWRCECDDPSCTITGTEKTMTLLEDRGGTVREAEHGVKQPVGWRRFYVLRTCADRMFGRT
jgi:hypothetical protein